MSDYFPEGWLCGSEKNNRTIESPSGLREAIKSGSTVEAVPYIFDSESRALKFHFPGAVGIMPFELCSDEPMKKDISVMACVGRPVAFKVLEERQVEGECEFLLSRAAAMSECRLQYCSLLVAGDIINCTVTHIERFGCFVDIGCGITALLPTDSLCYSHISNPSCLFNTGERIKAAVRRRDALGRILLTHKELLGTFSQNCAGFSSGDTVSGTVRSVKSYGIFIELTPNLTGLAEYRDGVEPGDHVSVYIKSIIPERLKIKLVIISRLSEPAPRLPLRYYFTSEHIDLFRYSPAGCEKTIETFFI